MNLRSWQDGRKETKGKISGIKGVKPRRGTQKGYAKHHPQSTIPKPETHLYEKQSVVTAQTAQVDADRAKNDKKAMLGHWYDLARARSGDLQWNKTQQDFSREDQC